MLQFIKNKLTLHYLYHRLSSLIMERAQQPVLFLSILCMTLFSYPIFGQVRQIQPGVVYSTEMELTRMYTDYLSYAVTVPENAQAMKISIFNASADLDLFINYEKEIDNYDSVHLYSVSDQYNEELFFTRFSDVSLKPGTYYFDITYQRKNFPTEGNKILEILPFSFKVDIFTEEVEKELSPGVPYTSTLFPTKGMFTTFTVSVPESAEFLRLDLNSAAADLDFLVQYGGFVKQYDTADYTADSLLGRETLLISKDSVKPLQKGDYYITVLDQISAEYPVEFTIYPQFVKTPPKELNTIIELPKPKTSLERVLLSTVEIITDSGKGSGCIISPGGLVVTNYHVIEGYGGKSEETLTIAATIDTKLPPVELFQGKVIEVDMEKDLVLLRIISGLYGQALPAGYIFPYVLLRDGSDYQIGDPIYCAGYPSIGGTGSRASITFTRGVISGFEKTSYGILLKTDGLINSGSSGGAAVDKDFRLVGLPTIIMEESAGQLGFILPVSLFPGNWIKLNSSKQELTR